MVHRSGSIALIRASPVRARLCRALLTSALLAGSLALAGCNTDVYQLPTRAMKEVSPEMLALLGQKGMPRESPLLVRIFKEELELEVWKQDTTGRFEFLKVYPICRWSGELGPKVREGDRQAPEGFYTITPALMNPNSNYYLAINTGFPNAYDRANGRSGAFLMIHGDCSSRGCYAMTDEQIGEIYSLARESFLGGQQSFQIQAYPFRMTAANLARHRTNPNMPFWRMIKEGNDHFEVTHMEPKVDVCDRHYVFDAQSPANSAKPLAFNPTGHCPAFEVSPQLAALVRDKEQHDEAQFTQLARFNAPVAPIKTGTDGGSNRVFIAQIENSTRTVDSEGHVHVVLPPAGSVPETTGAVADNSASQPSLASRLFGRMFGSKSSAIRPVSLRLTPAPAHRSVAAASSAICSRREAAAVARSRQTRRGQLAGRSCRRARGRHRRNRNPPPVAIPIPRLLPRRPACAPNRGSKPKRRRRKRPSRSRKRWSRRRPWRQSLNLLLSRRPTRAHREAAAPCSAAPNAPCPPAASKTAGLGCNSRSTDGRGRVPYRSSVIWPVSSAKRTARGSA